MHENVASFSPFAQELFDDTTDVAVPSPVTLLHESNLPYSNYYKHKRSHDLFHQKFVNNSFGYECTICQSLWFKNDLIASAERHINILNAILPNVQLLHIRLCSTCRNSLNRCYIPTYATYNGFVYHNKLNHLLDLVSERLISTRRPFMQIRRLSGNTLFMVRS